MRAEDIPPELLDILDRAAGRRHSRDGAVAAALAEILTRYDAVVRGARQPSGPCCDMHNIHCEQGGDECCSRCTEVHHFKVGHGGVPCVLPWQQGL